MEFDEEQSRNIKEFLEYMEDAKNARSAERAEIAKKKLEEQKRLEAEKLAEECERQVKIKRRNKFFKVLTGVAAVGLALFAGCKVWEARHTVYLPNDNVDNNKDKPAAQIVNLKGNENIFDKSNDYYGNYGDINEVPFLYDGDGDGKPALVAHLNRKYNVNNNVVNDNGNYIAVDDDKNIGNVEHDEVQEQVDVVDGQDEEKNTTETASGIHAIDGKITLGKYDGEDCYFVTEDYLMELSRDALSVTSDILAKGGITPVSFLDEYIVAGTVERESARRIVYANGDDVLSVKGAVGLCQITSVALKDLNIWFGQLGIGDVESLLEGVEPPKKDLVLKCLIDNMNCYRYISTVPTMENSSEAKWLDYTLTAYNCGGPLTASILRQGKKLDTSFAKDVKKIAEQYRSKYGEPQM